MNVQLSLSASTTTQSLTGRSASPESHSSPNETSATFDSSHEMAILHRQGGSLSIGEEKLLQNISKAVKALQGPETVLDISIHDKTNQILVKVIDKDTGELIREIPPEKTLDLVAKMMELAGIIIDAKV